MDCTDDTVSVMRNFACFNELSINPLCKTEKEAEQRVKDFFDLFRGLREHSGINKVKHNGYMSSIGLMPNMTMQDYCNSHMRDTRVIALLGIIIPPQVDEDDETSLQKYINTTTEVDLGNGKKAFSDGFTAAYCQGTFCIGFLSDPLWNNDFHSITVSSNGVKRDVLWPCISSVSFLNNKNRVSLFDSWNNQFRPIVLVKSKLKPESKSISLRGDHGKDKLDYHAKLLRNSPYVEAILTSLPFQSHSKSYIKNITDDGLVDIVLWWEDEGFSMRVKTTGRNAAETREIANILKEKYGKK